MSRFLILTRPLAASALGLGIATAALGQAAPASGASDPVDNKTVMLTPFEVNVAQDRGYVSPNTVAGSRLNTKLSDTPAAISVFDGAFLSDIDAVSTIDVLQYTLNGTRDFSDSTGLGNGGQQDFAVKIRGVSATPTRDYFDNPSSVSLDAFNTERIDFARGPNAILFGIASPGGVVNTTTKQAQLGSNTDTATFRVASWDDYRLAVDINHAITDKLAIRINAVMENAKSWQDFTDKDEQAIAGALSYRPFQNTTIQVQSEYDDHRQVLPIYFPTDDFTTNWLNAGRPIAKSDSTPVAGTMVNNSNTLVYDPTAPGGGLMSWHGTLQTAPSPVSPQVAGAVRDFTNFSLIPRSVNLAGSGQSTNTFYNFTNVFLNQQIGQFSAQLAYNHEQARRTANYVVTWDTYGVYADPNPFLPNGSPNPNVGRFYVQSNPSQRDLNSEVDSWRLTLSYHLDANRFHLGVHDLTGLLSRDKQDSFTAVQFLVNTTPNGSSTQPALLTNANNRIFERTYLDLSSPNVQDRGAFDPALHPINNVNGATAAYERVTNGGQIQTNLIDTAMVADQSSFFNDRLILTAGVRNDVEAFYNGGGATQDPKTGVFSLVREYYTENVYHGNTRTVGGVINVFPWLGLFYNNSDNFTPQTVTGLDGTPIGPKTGRDQDFGLKLDLWKNQIYLTLTHYQLSQTNVFATDTTLSTSIIPVINDIWTALNQPSRDIFTGARDTVDTAARGWELDLVGNITPSLTFMLNGSIDRLANANALRQVSNYLQANAGTFNQNANVPLIAPYPAGLTNQTNPTVSDALKFVQSTVATDQRTSLEVPRLQTEYSANAFAAYTFHTGNSWLNYLTLGGGLNYRGKPVTGYDSANGYSPVYGNENLVFSGLLSKRIRLRRGTLKFQLNIANLFNNQHLLTTVKDNTGSYQYIFQNPRTVAFTTSFTY